MKTKLYFLQQLILVLFFRIYKYHLPFNPFHSAYLQMGSLENSEDTDEMPLQVAFHKGLHYLQR